MTTLFSNPNMNRRSALAAMGGAGLGLAAMHLSAHAEDSAADGVRKLLPKFSDKSCTLLDRLIHDPGFSGQIPAAEVASLVQYEKTTVDGLMVSLLPLAKSYFEAPISHYPVGVVARGTSESLYLGANLEVPGHALNFSVHGEQSALSNAYMHSEQNVSAIAVTAAPCGHCRQFLYEMDPSGQLRILVAGASPAELSSLLPAAFGPKNLGASKGAFPVEEVGLAMTSKSSDEVTLAALDAARKSYAPYSKAHSGVALGTRSGRIFKGAYIENVAFNPSLSPLQTALSALIFGGSNYSAISRAVLVEVEGAAISQKAVTEVALGAVAPEVKLEIVTALP